MRYIFLILFLLNTSICFASLIKVSGVQYSDEQVARAIFDAEGGASATYLYGIRSVHYSDVAEARRICLNTIKHAKKDYKAFKVKEPFIEWLSRRYCPLNDARDIKGLNKNWVKNVKWFLHHNR